jgi:hypothetical protein
MRADFTLFEILLLQLQSYLIEKIWNEGGVVHFVEMIQYID